MIAPEYPLAPQNAFPCGLDICLEITKEVLSTYENVSIGGDSSGGNFTAVIAKELVETCNNLPKSVIYLFPFLSPITVKACELREIVWNEALFAKLIFCLAYTGSNCGKDTLDKHLSKLDELKELGKIFDDHEIEDFFNNPRVSPCLQCEDDLQKIANSSMNLHMESAEYDMLIDENVEYYQRLKKAGSNITLHIENGVTHNWPQLSSSYGHRFTPSKFPSQPEADKKALEFFTRIKHMVH